MDSDIRFLFGIVLLREYDVNINLDFETIWVCPGCTFAAAESEMAQKQNKNAK